MAKKEMQIKLPKQILFCAIVFFVIGIIDIISTTFLDFGTGVIIFGVVMGFLEILIGFGLLKMRKLARKIGSVWATIAGLLYAYNLVNALYITIFYGESFSIFNLITLVLLVLLIFVTNYLSKNKDLFK